MNKEKWMGWKWFVIAVIPFVIAIIVEKNDNWFLLLGTIIPLWILYAILFNKWYVDREEVNKLIKETKEGILKDMKGKVK